MTTPPFRPDRSPIVLWIMIGSAVINSIPLIIGAGGPLNVTALIGGVAVATLITVNRRQDRIHAQQPENRHE